MKKIKRILTGMSVVALGIGLVTGMNGTKVQADEKDTIAKGVYIGNVDVGGMTQQEAQNAVDTYVNSLMSTNFTLSGAVGMMNLTASEMGILAETDIAVEEAMEIGKSGDLISRFKESEDLGREKKVVDMHLSIDRQTTAQKIYEKREELNVAAIDNSFRIEDGNFTFIPGQTGNEVNVVNSVYAIEEFLNNEWDVQKNEIALVIDTIEPRGSEEELSKLTDVLGSFSTDFSSSAAGRAQNVRNACSKINGTILYPGEEFSTYEKISPFTEENGYGIAGAYENGQVVESVGGGVCQVATTLYNAVIRAELEVSMRYNHSMMVSYVPPSDDAAIAGTYKDFRFKNNLSTPVYIEGYCDGGVIYFKVYGVETRADNRSISFESETLERKDPEVQINVSGDYDLGYISTTQGSHQGVVARLWKIVTVDGVEESREVFNNSTYNASPRIIVVGIRGASDEQASAIRSAASSGDESAVRSAVEAAKAEAEKPEEPEEPEEPEKKPEDEPDDAEKPEEKPQVEEEPEETPVEEPEELEDDTDGDENVNSDDLIEEEE